MRSKHYRHCMVISFYCQSIPSLSPSLIVTVYMYSSVQYSKYNTLRLDWRRGEGEREGNCKRTAAERKWWDIHIRSLSEGAQF